MDHITRHIS